MHNHPQIRRGMIAAGMMLAFTAVPFSQAFAAPDSETTAPASDNQTVPDKAADAWITTKVKAEFGTTRNIPATGIAVHTSDGVVTLTGSVANQTQKMLAMRVASKVKGVKSVDASGLSVAATPHTP